MLNILVIFLVIFTILVCLIIFFLNYRRKSGNTLEQLENARQLGIITDEEQEYIKQGLEPDIELCTISPDEIMEAIDILVPYVNELEKDQGYKGEANWATAFGFQSNLEFSIKDLTVFNMSITESTRIIDLIARIIELNVPLDAIGITQTKGKSLYPNYRLIARIIWIQIRKQLEGLISKHKGIYKNQKGLVESLLIELATAIMKFYNMPIASAGFAVLMALAIGKVEFWASLEE